MTNAYSSLGHIVPYSYNLASINDLAETLRLNVSGALYHGSDFTMLVYPPNSEDWTFLDHQLPEAPAVGLRCFIGSPMRNFATAYNNDCMEGLNGPHKKRRMPISFKVDEPTINAVMRNVYHIDYYRLVRHANQRRSMENLKFFLIFPKERKAEQELTLEFIEANGAAEVYAHDEESSDGAWEYFSRNVKEGVIIVRYAPILRFPAETLIGTFHILEIPSSTELGTSHEQWDYQCLEPKSLQK